jgi:RNA polymerase-binding transcription factor DksA
VTDDRRGDLLAQRKLAKARLQALTAEHDAIVAAAEGANGDDEHDPEGATVAYERATVAALVANSQSALQAVDAALTRLDAGFYGTCVSCGHPVDAERLAAQPATLTCMACATGARPRALPRR